LSICGWEAGYIDVGLVDVELVELAATTVLANMIEEFQPELDASEMLFSTS